MNNMHTSHCDSIQPLITDALFGDIDAADKKLLTAHLDRCPECTQMFAEMRSTLEMTKQVSDVDMPDTYWLTFQNRLNDRLAGQQKQPTSNFWMSWLRRLFVPAEQPRFVLAYQIGMAVVLILVGVLIGRYGLTRSSYAPTLASEQGGQEASAALQVTAQAESYLTRSSVLLLGLVNHDLDSDAVLNFDHKREVAGTLVQQAAVLKASLNPSKEAQLLMLVEELEKILLQISNLEIQEDMPGIEVIQEGIEGRALLLKINLETMKLMDKPASAPTNTVTS